MNFDGITITASVACLVVFLSVVYAIATIRYPITEEAVEVVILGRVVRRIRLDDIVGVWRGGSFKDERWTTFRFWNSVTLCRKSGRFKHFVITPENPDRFIIELAQKLENIDE